MAETKRIDRGRNHTYKLDGEKATGVTTILGDGLPKPALVPWAAGTVGDFVSDRLQIRTVTPDDVGQKLIVADDVVEDLRAIGAQRNRPIPDWRELGKLPRTKLADGLKGLPYADRDRAGGRGSEVHRIAQLLAEGEEVEVPEELRGHVDAYLSFRDDFEPYDEIVEFTVVNRRYHYMGTGDVISRLRRREDLGVTLYDLKTNRSGPFGEVGLQLAGYGNAETMLTDDGEVPMPAIDSYGVLWLRSDGYDFFPFDVTEADFRTFLYVQQVAQFVNGRSREIRGDALRPLATSTGGAR